MEEEKREKSYKIEEGDIVKVWRSEWNNKTFYNVMISQKLYDGTSQTWYRPITFKNGVSVPNGARILIKRMFENLRNNSKDKYNPITSLMILDFEIISNEEETLDQAIGEYNEEITDDDLPF